MIKKFLVLSTMVITCYAMEEGKEDNVNNGVAIASVQLENINAEGLGDKHLSNVSDSANDVGSVIAKSGTPAVAVVPTEVVQSNLGEEAVIEGGPGSYPVDRPTTEIVGKNDTCCLPFLSWKFLGLSSVSSNTAATNVVADTTTVTNAPADVVEGATAVANVPADTVVENAEAVVNAPADVVVEGAAVVAPVASATDVDPVIVDQATNADQV